jgi:mycothione reductase
MKTYDLLVVGSGAGLNVAVEVAGAGKKVCIIEKGPMGGTCLNRGCIPSKIVIHSAEVAEQIRRAKEFGIEAPNPKVNFKFVTDRANKMVDSDARNIERSVKSGKNPRLIKGTAKFVGMKTVVVKGEKVRGKQVLIATGARPFIPPIEGLDTLPYMTSTEALRQTKLPKSMIVVGGGYIGVELGRFYADLGCSVTIVQRGPLLIPREDKDVTTLFTKIWKKKYNVITNAGVFKVKKRGQGVQVFIKKGNKISTLVAEKIFVATGVKPNSDVLNVAKTGVRTNKRGFVHVNKFMETNVPGIYALGDVAGVYMFRHSANLEADFVTHNVTHKQRRKVDYFPMPHAIFTSPEIAGVGLTEQQAIEQKKDYVVGKAFYKNTGKGAALAEKDGFVKFIVARNRKILGCHIIGPQASVLLHEVLIAMKCGKKALTLLRNVVHVHPALNEVVQRAAANVPL